MRISDWSSDVCSSDLIKKTDKKATYDWDKGVATWSGDVKPERAGPVKLQPGDVDALLLNLELARDVQAGEPLDYRMVDDGRVKSMTYKRSEEHTSELQSLMRNSYAVFCLKTKNTHKQKY